MKVHNLMEDYVIKRVNDICDEKVSANPEGVCTSPQCRLDITCFVLNRLPPMYVTTGKGLAHVENSVTSNQQTEADIAALIHEGLRRVSEIKRSYYDQARAAVRLGTDGPFFNFPTIKGRLFHGVTFEPLSGIDVSLFLDDTLVPMFDNRWQNPYPMAETTAGTYLFWPQPIKTEDEGVSHTFSFELRASGEGFDELSHFFDIPSISEKSIRDSFEIPQTYRIDDLYIFPK